ncbi:MAG: hypothetical protein ABIP51_15965 [Bacteroidia bacterium]
MKVNDLPIYSDPTAYVAGDKAKFNYDKEQKDWVVIDILKLEDSPTGGFLVTWSFEHDSTKKFRTFIRAGNVILNEPIWVVCTTVPVWMIKCFGKPHKAVPTKYRCKPDINI